MLVVAGGAAMTGVDGVEVPVDASAPLSTDAVIADVLASHPDVVSALTAAHAAAWDAVDPRLLDLCRIRAAQLIGGPIETTTPSDSTVLGADTRRAVTAWPSSPLFDDRDRAVLAWCEMFVMDVASLDDAIVAAVREHLGDAGLLDLTSALLVVEQRQRLRCTWERLFGRPGAPP